jgi:hypothetical protein
MSSVKIINVLRGDTFSEILEHFRQAPIGEVIFVLPRAGKVFTKEDHFSAFAAEAAGSGKLVSILSSNSTTNSLARKYGFTVMSSSKPQKVAAVKPKPLTPSVTLVSHPVQVGNDVPSLHASESDVPLTSDESMGQDDAEDSELPEGFHAEGEDDDINDDLTHDAADELESDGPSDDALAELEEVSVPGQSTVEASLVASQVDGVRQTNTGKPLSVAGVKEKAQPLDIRPQQDADVDYLDAVWRSRQSNPDAPINNSSRVALAATTVRSKLFKRPVALVLGALVILGLIGVFAATTGNATISIEPVAEPLELDIRVQTSDMNTRIDAQLGKIPGQLIELSKTAEHSTPATGTRTIASKARGKVTLSNEFSSAPQSLIATTRLLSSDGKLFRTMQNVTIPGATVKGGSSVPGTTTVDIIADQPGPEYNIPAGKFRIAAFEEKKDAERLAKIYATSSLPMSGGTNGPSSIATQENIDLATTTATQKLVDQIKTALTSQDSDFVALGIDKPTIDSTRKSAEVDQAAEVISVTITGSLKTVAFRSKDLYQLIGDTILAQRNRIVFPSQLSLEYKDPTFSSATGSLEFVVHVKGNGYHSIKIDDLKESLKGKTSEQAQAVFRESADIKSATIKLSPFWVRRIPENPAITAVNLSYPTPSTSPVDKAQ